MPEVTADRSGYVCVQNRNVYWEYFGRGDREAICLLNGVAMSTHSWYAFLSQLLAEYDVILFDYWGQGNSFSEDAPYSIPSFCDALTKIVDTLAIQRFHLMGISYGGFVGLDYARRYQERLHTLTISGILLTHEELFEMYEELSLLFYRSGQMELYAYYLYEKIFGESFVRKIGPRLAEMRQKLIERYQERGHCLIQLTLAQDRLFAELDANLPGYRAIKTPVLIMAGAEDRTIPPGVQKDLHHPAELALRSDRRFGTCCLSGEARDFFWQSKEVRSGQVAQFLAFLRSTWPAAGPKCTTDWSPRPSVMFSTPRLQLEFTHEALACTSDILRADMSACRTRAKFRGCATRRERKTAGKLVCRVLAL